MALQGGFEGSKHASLIAASRDLKSLHPEEGTVAPITPLEGEGDEPHGLRGILRHQYKPEVWVRQDLLRRCLVIGPLVLHPFTVSLQEGLQFLEVGLSGHSTLERTAFRHSLFIALFICNCK